MLSFEGQVLAISMVCYPPDLSEHDDIGMPLPTVSRNWIEALDLGDASNVAYYILMEEQKFPSWWYEHELEWVRIPQQ